MVNLTSWCWVEVQTKEVQEEQVIVGGVDGNGNGNGNGNEIEEQGEEVLASLWNIVSLTHAVGFSIVVSYESPWREIVKCSY